MTDDSELLLSVEPGRDFFTWSGADLPDLRTPKGHRAVHVTTPSTPELEDIASLRRDIELAKLFATEHVRVSAESTFSTRSPEFSMAIAAVVMYGRAFATGVRGTKPEIDDLAKDLQEFHQYVIDLRNKHVAHSVSAHENVAVIAYLTNNSFQPPGIERLGQVHMEYAPMTVAEAESLIALCDVHLERLAVRSNRVRQRVFDELVELGKDAIYAFPDVAPSTSTANVGKPRKRRT